MSEKTNGHTAGPWEVDSGMVQTVAEHTCKTPGCGVHVPIAYMDREPGNGTLPVERDANARLIAAAPDLLEACKAFESLLTRYMPIGKGQPEADRALEQARDAIRKALKLA